ncbi:MAG: hypothetical protein LBG70_00005, partial [Bifidobacteriaceae bacterium]|nr:hypothetical protein [Bifidobacteriaceae bacterium]
CLLECAPDNPPLVETFQVAMRQVRSASFVIALTGQAITHQQTRRLACWLPPGVAALMLRCGNHLNWSVAKSGAVAVGQLGQLEDLPLFWQTVTQ